MERLLPKMIEKQTTYDINAIYIGYIAKQQEINENGKIITLKNLIDNKPRMFKYAAVGYYQDIETEKYYPMVGKYQEPEEDGLYIAEEYCKSFKNVCSQDNSVRLTAKQCREMLDKQLESNRFCL